jgi:hypothetical protein
METLRETDNRGKRGDKKMKIAKETREGLEFIVQVLGIASIVIWASFLAMILGVALGAFAHSDTSTLSEITKWLFHHPAILLTGLLFIFWAIRIWSKQDKEETYKVFKTTRRNRRAIAPQKPQR